MKNRLDRREFLAAAACAASGLALGLTRESHAQEQFKHSLHKALICGKPTEDYLKKIKGVGFEGVEAGIIPPADAAVAREVAEKLQMRIHSVLRGWAEFNSPDPQKVAASVKTTEDALRAAQAYGADAVLLVPCRIGGKEIAMPQPWEFRIQFDDKTGHLTAVAEKDNEKYKAYMEAHDHAYDTSRDAIQKLIPVAEETKVVIAVENVWNNLFIDIRHMAHFLDSFNSPWVRAYFDFGNHMKYAPAEQCVTILGKRLAKCHVKDFKLNPDGHNGTFVEIRDGSVNWPAVRKALDEVGYDGWLTIEGGKLPIEEQSMRLDQIIAGT